MLLTRKEIAQQAEHQAKDSDKWRELESVTCPSTRVILFILSNLFKHQSHLVQLVQANKDKSKEP